MKNHEIAAVFNQMADLLEILGENVFRVTSYRNAARVLEDLSEDVAALAAAGKLEELHGIGERTRQKIEEYLKTGKIAAHQDLLKKVPPHLPILLRIPGMGPKTVLLAWKQLGIEDAEDLRKAIDSGELEKLPGMGVKKIEKIRKGMEFLARSADRTPLGIALPRAREIVDAIRKLPGVKRAEPAGSLRRWVEAIGDIDVVVVADDGENVLKQFSRLPQVEEVLALGQTKASVRIVDNLQVDVRVVPVESFGAAWMYFTGSKPHNIHLRELAIKEGWKLNEYGLYHGARQIAGETEESVYHKFGLPCFPPELREDRGEYEQAKHLPTLIEPADIRGDLHMHTMASDGRCTIEEMVEACIQRGYEYLCISDHSQSSKIAHGLDRGQLAAHIRKVRKAAERYKREILVLVGGEVDILSDGRMDYEDALLAELDYVTASVHSGLNQPMEQITSRILKAMDNPHVRTIGHLTGRIIGMREASQVNVPAVLAHAVETGTWIELNASWSRLDISDVHCRQAKEAGAKLVICTDSHDTPQLDQMQFGVHTARRGWIEPADVINTLPADRLRALLSGEKTPHVPQMT